jgi:glycerophosphoryl diester phosphodiesterase
MPHLIDQIARPAIIAHRGASAHAPENTLSAFKMALDHNADGVELDAKLTIDGKIVVIHDQTVDRTTGAHGIVREMTLAQLKALDAGSFFDSAFSGERIPTLEEVFVAVGSRALINVEITNYTSVWDALPDKIADLVIKYGLQDHIIFSSFHPLNLMRVKRRLPNVPAAILTDVGRRGWLLRGEVGRLITPRFIHPYYTDVNEAILNYEHRRGRRVNVWTVDNPEEIRRLFKMGIDGIITDDPRLARRVVEEK